MSTPPLTQTSTIWDVGLCNGGLKPHNFIPSRIPTNTLIPIHNPNPNFQLPNLNLIPSQNIQCLTVLSPSSELASVLNDAYIYPILAYMASLERLMANGILGTIIGYYGTVVYYNYPMPSHSVQRSITATAILLAGHHII